MRCTLKTTEKQQEMARFKPGESGNPAGRPRGTRNKTPEQIRKIIAGVLSEYVSKDILISDLRKLDPKDRLQAIDRLIKHVLPAPVDEILKLTDDDLNRLADTIKHKYFDNDGIKKTN